MSDQPINHELESLPELSISGIDIGDPQIWIELYKEQALLDENLNRSSNNANLAIVAMLDVTARMQLERQIAEESMEATGLFEITSEVTTVGNQLIGAQQNAIDAYQNVIRIYGEVSFKEWELGCDLESIEPAVYITRAIGSPSYAINKRYLQVRAEIEIFRQLTGQENEEITLGNSTNETWVNRKMNEIVLNVQKLQIAQIGLSDNPTETAKLFDKQTVLKIIGLPPTLAPEDMEKLIENSDKFSWFKDAVEICREIEPIEYGLSIDGNSL